MNGAVLSEVNKVFKCTNLIGCGPFTLEYIILPRKVYQLRNVHIVCIDVDLLWVSKTIIRLRHFDWNKLRFLLISPFLKQELVTFVTTTTDIKVSESESIELDKRNDNKLADCLKSNRSSISGKMETLRRAASWTSRRMKYRKGMGFGTAGSGGLSRGRSSSEDRDLPPRIRKSHTVTVWTIDFRF